jgi:hypothetical protein
MADTFWENIDAGWEYSVRSAWSKHWLRENNELCRAASKRPLPQI